MSPKLSSPHDRYSPNNPRTPQLQSEPPRHLLSMSRELSPWFTSGIETEPSYQTQRTSFLRFQTPKRMTPEPTWLERETKLAAQQARPRRLSLERSRWPCKSKVLDAPTPENFNLSSSDLQPEPFALRCLGTWL